MILVPDFLNESQATALLSEIETTPFALAQSGKRKQHYGAKINFNKQKLNSDAFKGLPAYTQNLEQRLREAFLLETKPSAADLSERARALARYQTTDLFVLRYHERDASNLDLHTDDTFAYGEAIIDVSLESDSVLTFVRNSSSGMRPNDIECVRVPLPARSAALLYGPARFEWEHGILAYDICGRRTSITLRTLSEQLRATEEGQRVLEAAKGQIRPNRPIAEGDRESR